MSKKSDVAFVKIKDKKEGVVQKNVRKAMKLARWKKYVKGERIFLKLNAMSGEMVPGQCTSPWVFEGVLQELTEKLPNTEIFFGDADVATSRQIENSVKMWGTKEVGEKYGAEFLNLSKQPMKKHRLGEKIGDMEIPKILTDVDAIVTLPVVKTHCLTTMTGSLKNQWGLLPRCRYQYHCIVNDAIAEINKFFNVVFAVADMTVSMEGPAARFGLSKICNLVLASHDRVALDTVASSYMGLAPNEIKSIVRSEKIGVGTMNYNIIGDEFEVDEFMPPKSDDQIVYRWKNRVERIPILGKLLLDTSFYKLLGHFANLYNQRIWYPKSGKKNFDFVCNDPLYKKEFKNLGK